MSSATAAHLVSAVSAGPTDHKPILAARFKTKMCRNHVVHGFCPYEQRCMFAHGEDDMRTKEMNLADQLTTEEAIKAFQRAKFAAKARAAMLAVAEDSESAVLPALPEVEDELVSWKDVVKQRADGSYRYSPYSRWAPFFVEADLVESSAPLAPFVVDPIEAPIAPRWTAYSCTCPACQCGAPVAQAPSAAPPKYVAEMAPRHKVLVP